MVIVTSLGAKEELKKYKKKGYAIDNEEIDDATKE